MSDISPIAETLLNTCPTDINTHIAVFFDARGLSCPMPLLKAKVSLRSVADGESLYLVASDKNSQTDLIAFCQKNGFATLTWTSHAPDTIFHFIITKNY